MNKVFAPIALLVILFITIVTSSCSQGNSPNPPSASSPPQLTPQSSPSNQINMKLQEAAVFLGPPIPVPKYSPAGYEIGDVQIIEPLDSKRKVDLTITKQNAQPITLSITWWMTGGGVFRILPTSQNATSIDISGGPGTYSKWAMLNKFSDHNTLWWDWTPTENAAGSFPYYELVLSADKGTSVDDLALIAKSVRLSTP